MSDSVRFSRTRAVSIIFIALLLGGILGWQIIQPVRTQLSARYLERGDAYLAGEEFATAVQEYQKALSFDANNKLAKDHLELAQKAPTDIAAAREFYAQHDVQPVLQLLAVAQKPYATPKEALVAGVSLYNKQDFVYAQYPLQRAVQLDPEYPEAWHYLGLTYQALAKIDPSFLAPAEAAWQKRNILTPKYLVLPTPH